MTNTLEKLRKHSRHYDEIIYFEKVTPIPYIIYVVRKISVCRSCRGESHRPMVGEREIITRRKQFPPLRRRSLWAIFRVGKQRRESVWYT